MKKISEMTLEEKLNEIQQTQMKIYLEQRRIEELLESLNAG